MMQTASGEDGALAKENAELRKEIVELRNENKTLKMQPSALAKENAELRKEIVALRNENATLKARLSEYTGEQPSAPAPASSHQEDEPSEESITITTQETVAPSAEKGTDQDVLPTLTHTFSSEDGTEQLAGTERAAEPFDDEVESEMSVSSENTESSAELTPCRLKTIKKVVKTIAKTNRKQHSELKEELVVVTNLFKNYEEEAKKDRESKHQAAQVDRDRKNEEQKALHVATQELQVQGMGLVVQSQNNQVAIATMLAGCQPQPFGQQQQQQFGTAPLQPTAVAFTNAAQPPQQMQLQLGGGASQQQQQFGGQFSAAQDGSQPSVPQQQQQQQDHQQQVGGAYHTGQGQPSDSSQQQFGTATHASLSSILGTNHGAPGIAPGSDDGTSSRRTVLDGNYNVASVDQHGGGVAASGMAPTNPLSATTTEIPSSSATLPSALTTTHSSGAPTQQQQQPLAIGGGSGAPPSGIASGTTSQRGGGGGSTASSLGCFVLGPDMGIVESDEESDK